MKRFIRKLHILPKTREEARTEWEIAAGMVLTAALTAGMAVMAWAATFRGWLP